MWFFIFILIPLSGSPASACEMQFSPRVAVVKFGGSLSATCSFSSCTNVVKMGWETTYSAGGMQINGSSIQLNITEVKDWNPEPQCYVTFSDGDQLIRTLQIIVYKTPTYVHFNRSQWGPVVEGHPYDLECNVGDVVPVAYLSVLWYKGNEKFSETSNFSSTSNDATSSITVVPHRDDDGIEMWCEANLYLLPTGQEPKPSAVRSERRTITVKYPPTFAQPENETLKVASDTNTTLNCSAAGNPSPSYIWRFAHSSQEKMQNQNGSRSILSPKVLLSGIYSCTASNDLGQETKYFTVPEAEGNRTTFAAILGGFLFLGVALFVAGLIFVQQNGKFSLPKAQSGVI